MDGDGIPNRFDLDSDGDGASDADEGSADVDGNSIPNFVDNGTLSAIPANDQDNDDDLDGFDDPDQDGIANYLDDDSDGDGIPDRNETNADLDADGTPNFLDDDSDGDSISDLVEGDADTDGDGGPDYLQSASDLDTRDGGVEASDTIKVGTGCSISSDSRFVDPLLPMLFIIACFMIRKRRLQPQLSGCK